MLPIFVLTGCLQALFSYNIINISKFGEKYMTNREKFEDIFGFTPGKEVNYGTNDPEGVITIPVVLTGVHREEWWDEEYIQPKSTVADCIEKPTHAEKFIQVFGFEPCVYLCPAPKCSECFIVHKDGCTDLQKSIFWHMPYVKASVELRRRTYPCYVCQGSTYWCQRDEHMCRYAACLEDLWDKHNIPKPYNTFDPFDISQLSEKQINSINNNIRKGK